MLLLFKTYALSAGMYASQFRATRFLKAKDIYSSPLQVARMAFLKRVLRIKSTSARWCSVLCRKETQEPLQFYWYRTAVKFWNWMVEGD
jgi:hypothetical protein